MAITEVIKYEGDNSTFIWKHPCEDFHSLTQLIVHESQEAVFFMNGEALDTFGPGRHTLETENIPLLGKVLNRITGDTSPFHCEVYFINQTVQMDMKWGTDAKVRYIEPEYGVPLELGASGSMNLRVLNGRKLLTKLVGTMNGIAWEDSGRGFTKSLQNSFRPLISTAVKSNLTSAIKEQHVNIFEVDEHLTELSKALHEKVLPGFEDYGLTIPEFYLTTVVLPESDPNFRRIRELHTIALQLRMTQAEAQVRTAQAEAEAGVTAARRQIELERQTTETEVARREAERRIIAAQAEAEAARQAGFAEAQVMQAQGVTKKDYLQAEIQRTFAESLGTMGQGGGGGSSTMGDILGLGIGLQAAGAVGGQVGALFQGMAPQGMAAGSPAAPAAKPGIQCPKCGTVLPEGAKFCFGCGTKIEESVSDQITCPHCGALTPKGKFCMACGAKLQSSCPSCGAEVPPGAKFCLQCGEKLA